MYNVCQLFSFAFDCSYEHYMYLSSPTGSLGFNACEVDQVSDFYPIFFNPSQDYVHQLKCSYEVVYPL